MEEKKISLTKSQAEYQPFKSNMMTNCHETHFFFEGLVSSFALLVTAERE